MDPNISESSSIIDGTFDSLSDINVSIEIDETINESEATINSETTINSDSGDDSDVKPVINKKRTARVFESLISSVSDAGSDFKENNDSGSEEEVGSHYDTIDENVNDVAENLDTSAFSDEVLPINKRKLKRDIESLNSSISDSSLNILPDERTQNEQLPQVESSLNVARNQLKKILSSSSDSVEYIPLDDDNVVDIGSDSDDSKPKLSSNKEFNIGKHLVDDVLPTHTGKVGLANFNSRQGDAMNVLQHLQKSIEDMPDPQKELSNDPEGLKTPLMPHQKYALEWMSWRERQKIKGGILADDMGLGKTFSLISLILKRQNEEKNNEDESDSEEESDSDSNSYEKKSSWISKGAPKSYYYGGTLVVCPASLLDQWKNEVSNRVKKNLLSVTLHHGHKRETVPRRLGKFDVVVTTYGIVSSEFENNGALFSIKWERVILDEAHNIRNHTTKQSVACCALKSSARWVLTGTPIQNKEMDIFALFKFLRCYPFNNISSFKMWISSNSSKAQERLRQILRAIMLRRTKEELKSIGEIESLPDKSRKIIPVKLNVEEMNVYQKVMIFSQHLFAQFLRQHQNRHGYMTSNQQNTIEQQEQQFFKLHRQIIKVHGTEEVSGHQILLLILRLRQICIHPSLIDAMLSEDCFSEDSDTENIPEINLLEQLKNLNLNDDDNLDNTDATVAKSSAKVLHRSNPIFNADVISSKFQAILDTILLIIPSGDKIIVVSQFATVLKMFGDHLIKNKINFVALTGSTKITSRNEIVTSFNKTNTFVQVMLLSLTAGGVGLNLCGANHLIFMDPHWNPQLENQAQDRIYRMGQKKPVTIYKFLCDDTIERRIEHLQEKKLSISNHVLTGEKRQTKLTIDDMKTLFDL